MMQSNQQYIVTITDNDRSYNSCKLNEYKTSSKYELPISIIPLENELFNNDIVEIHNSSLKLIHSQVRTSTLTGVLILENNKTYGRTDNKKRLLYKCIPNDIKLPIFLIPYDIKFEFIKVQTNKYILFKYDNWTHKHPHGIIVETIGDVDKLDAFFDYQLHCADLHISLNKFSQKTRQILNNDTSDEFVETMVKKSLMPIEDRRNRQVITIDPFNSLDFDDGIGIEPILIDSIHVGWTVSVYISNVFFWLEMLELWDDMTSRASTIYLPDKKLSMLPLILSDVLCSLQQDRLRVALAMDVQLDLDGIY